MKTFLQFFWCLILLNSIISAVLLQGETAKAEGESVVQAATATYHLDLPTLARGYPAMSADGRFRLLIWPNFFTQPTDVEIYGPQTVGDMLVYRFKLTQDGQVPILAKKLTISISTADAGDDDKYQRLYYYHQTGDSWLSLAAHMDTGRQLVISEVIDFSQADIGLLVGSTPQPDRINNLSFYPAGLATDITAATTGAFYDYTLGLGNDIIAKGYTIDWQGIKLGVGAQAMLQPSVLTLKWQSKDQVLNYDFQPAVASTATAILRPGAQLILSLPTVFIGVDKEIVFWDNNWGNWRALPSNYRYPFDRVIAKTPFAFGRYRVQERPGRYVGTASWFPDRLISQTLYAAACNDFPLGTKLIVTNLANQKTKVVEVRSTGPFVPGRVIDLNYSAFSAIADPRDGLIRVKVEKAT